MNLIFLHKDRRQNFLQANLFSIFLSLTIKITLSTFTKETSFPLGVTTTLNM